VSLRSVLIRFALMMITQTAVAIEPDEAMRSKVAHHFREQLSKGEAIELPVLDLYGTPKTGDFGTVNKEKGVTVFQKLGDDEALIFLDFRVSSGGSSGTFSGFGAARGGGGPTSTTIERKGPFHFKGDAVKGLADNAEFPLVGVFSVVNAQEYLAVNGAMQTAPSLVQIDGLKIPKAPSEIDPPLRTWKDKTGKHATEAKFVSFKSGKLNIEKADGKLVEIPLAQLSADDQEHVRDLMKTDREYEQLLKRKLATGR
jgi:hypothetical protein